MNSIIHVIVAMATLAAFAAAYRTGAPVTQCDSMLPNHGGTTPQSSTPPPFNIEIASATYMPGGTVTGSLSGGTFRGFMIQARIGNFRVPGNFTAISDGAQFLHCDDPLGSAITHDSAATKSQVMFAWKAPDFAVGSIRFRATVVQSYTTYWENILSRELAISMGTSGTAATTNANATIEASTTAPTQAPTQAPPQLQPALSFAKCGTEKSCISWGAVACSPVTCDVAVNYIASATHVSIEMTAVTPGYVAIGFSSDKNMGNDDVIACMIKNDSFVVLNEFRNPGGRTPSVRQTNRLVTDIQAEYVNGRVTCRFRRPLSNGGDSDHFDLASPLYHFIATGRVSNGALLQHDEIPRVSDNKRNMTSITVERNTDAIVANNSSASAHVNVHTVMIVTALVMLVDGRG